MLKISGTGRKKEKLGGTGSGAAQTFYVEIPDKAGAFQMAARIELEPGASIGYHRHADDEEVYVVLAGRGVYTEEGQSAEAKAGDVFLCRQGNSHGLENNSADALILAAAIAQK